MMTRFTPVKFVVVGLPLRERRGLREEWNRGSEKGKKSAVGNSSPTRAVSQVELLAVGD